MQPKVSADKKKYLEALRLVIAQMHGCGAVWLRTDHVHEAFQGKTVWKVDVEVFALIHHPSALHCYAWANLKGKDDEKTRFVAILESRFVKGAKTAVQASIVAGGTNDGDWLRVEG
jgi:hypothetical protein